MVSCPVRFPMAVMCLCTALTVTCAAFAQEVAEQGTVAAEKAELKKLAATAEVQAELEEPDGVSVEDLDTDNWKILARGTGTYDFNDAEDRKDATEEAILDAKAALVRFMKENMSTDSDLDKLAEQETKKSKANGAADVSVTKNRMKTTLGRLHGSADGILSGILTLESTTKWDGNSGEVRVTLGQSEKSLAAAEKFKTRTGNSVTRADQAAGTAGAKAGGSGMKANGPEAGEPSTIKRKSKTAF